MESPRPQNGGAVRSSSWCHWITLTLCEREPNADLTDDRHAAAGRENNCRNHQTMIKFNQNDPANTKASSVDDAFRRCHPACSKNSRGCAIRQDPVCSANKRGFTTEGRRRDASDLAQSYVRVATLNVGTLTGKSREIAADLKRRKIDILAIQETKWKGGKAKEIGDGYKLYYMGTETARNGVAIVVAERLRDQVCEVTRYTGRLMKIKLALCETTVHYFSVYAPQTGCTDKEKLDFWEMLDEKMAEVPEEDYVIIAGDMNAHVGQTDESECHGGYGIGEKNAEGEQLLEFATTHNLTITNTNFTKRPSHLYTYYHGTGSQIRKSQIDFVLVRRKHKKTVLDTKVIPSETTATQHKPLICDLKIEVPRKPRPEQTKTSRIKWWKLREEDTVGTKAKLARIRLPSIHGVQDTWTALRCTIHLAAKHILGSTKPCQKYIDKETWFWTEEVKDAVKAKKNSYKALRIAQTQENKDEYHRAKKKARKQVAIARSNHLDNLYQKLDTREGEKGVYRLARSRRKKAADIEKFHGISNEQGKLIIHPQDVLERWRRYFKAIFTEEFEHPPIPEGTPNHTQVDPLNGAEVSEAMMKMKPGKANGPDDLAVDFWRINPDEWTPWLTNFLQKIVDAKEVPEDWSRSITIPIWKQKGSPADCENYRPIRLLSHTMKIFERVLDKRIRDSVKLSVNQAGFVRNCGAIDAIHSARLLLEKHREKKQPLHVAFLDLEKAFDRVPHKLIWYALRRRKVPEELIEWVKMLYKGTTSNVLTAAGKSREFPISVGVHQGSALSPLLFIIVMDVITKDLLRQAPWTILYADDVMLVSKDKHDLEQQVQQWHDRLAQFGLKLNTAKTEYMTTNQNEDVSISVNGVLLPKTTAFKYLGSVISSTGGVAKDVTTRINASWTKWRAATGVLCDKRMPDKLKSKFYRSVIRPVAMYGAECWAMTAEAERKLGCMETKMLRWIAGKTRLDHVRNEDIRKRFGVAPIADKLRESRLRWYGHVMRADVNTLAQAPFQIEVDGKRPIGRPQKRWMDTLLKDMKMVGLTPKDAAKKAFWRQRSWQADPVIRDKR